MKIDGKNITSFDIKVADYTPNTHLALEWFQTADNNWHATDWDSNSDYYECDITTYGTEAYINNIINQLSVNRAATDTIFLTSFATDEKIFGEDLDYNQIDATVSKMDPRASKSLNGWRLNMSLRAVSPSPTAVSTFDWSDVKCIQYNYDADRTWDINLYDSYDSLIYTYDHQSDAGICSFKLDISNDTLASLRQYQRIARGSSFILPNSGLFGVALPFGPRSGAGPHTIKLLDVKEDRRKSPFRWFVDVVISEVIS